MCPTKNPKTKTDNVPQTDIDSTTTVINTALHQLHLDVAESTNVAEDPTSTKNSTDKNSFIPSAMEPPPNGPPPLMGMNFHYSQMMNLPPHQQASFLPAPEFHPLNRNNSNVFPPSKGAVPPLDSNIDMPIFPNIPGPDGKGLNPYNILPLPQLMPPLNDPKIVPIWPGSNSASPSITNDPQLKPTTEGTISNLNADDSSAIDDGLSSINVKTPGAATIGIRRKTFHALSTKDLVDSANSNFVSSSNDKGGSNDELTSGTVIKDNSTTLGGTFNVGAKTRTMSTSDGISDRSNIFLPSNNSGELTSKKSKKITEKSDKEKLTDMNNPKTYAAAYPYGGPLLQNNPLLGDNGHMTASYPGGLHSPFPGSFEFGSPFHGFSPILGGPTPPLHRQSPIPPMGPSPIPMDPAHDVASTSEKEDNKVQNISTNAIVESPNSIHFPFQMMQPGHSGTPPPWMYSNPGFNPVMGAPHSPHHPHPHGHVPLITDHHGKSYTFNSNKNDRGNNFRGRHRNNDPHFYTNANKRRIEDVSRFVDATLDDYVGNIYSLCKDQYGCRFLQKQLDISGKEAAAIIFEETKNHTIELMTDSFGNYLIQKLIEKVTVEERKTLSVISAPFFVDIALNSHGTRALQKLIECVDTPDEAQIIVDALRNNVVTLSKDLNGNHVIQKCLQKLKPSEFQFIFDTAYDHSLEIATHRHGCCVLQRCLDFGTKEQSQKLCERLLSNIDKLTLDPFGNYVVQYIINKETEKNDYDYTYKIVHLLKPKITELSVHKFGSNVIEKILRTPTVSESMIVELLNNGGEKDIQTLLNDSYGNYVLQTALDICHKQNDYLYDKFSSIVGPLLVGQVRNTPHGKRIANMLNLSQPTET